MQAPGIVFGEHLLPLTLNAWLRWMVHHRCSETSLNLPRFLYFSFLFHFGFLLLPNNFPPESLFSEHPAVSAAEFCDGTGWNQAHQQMPTFAKELTGRFYVSKTFQQSSNSQPQLWTAMKKEKTMSSNGLESPTVYELGAITALRMKRLRCSTGE